MKAKEYYNKYHDELFAAEESTRIDAIASILSELMVESEQMIKQRGARCNNAAYGILRELNDKYNAIVSLCEQKDGFSTMLKDGFRLYWEKELPELKGHMTQKAVRPETARERRERFDAMSANRDRTVGHPVLDMSNPNAMATAMMLGCMATC